MFKLLRGLIGSLHTGLSFFFNISLTFLLTKLKYTSMYCAYGLMTTVSTWVLHGSRSIWGFFFVSHLFPVALVNQDYMSLESLFSFLTLLSTERYIMRLLEEPGV